MSDPRLAIATAALEEIAAMHGNYAGLAKAVARKALATATGTAKTPKAVECEASQSGGEAATPETRSSQSDGRGL